jgi:hypothetical protein
MRVETVSVSEYDDLLPASGVEPFHKPAFLRAAARHTPAELQLCAGYKGDQAVALLPLFVRERSVGRTVFSPPPSLLIPHMGPIMMPTSPKPRKQERVNSKFTEAVVEAYAGDDAGPLDLFRMIAGPSYDDPRPFRWAGFDVDSTFTYRLDLDVDSLDTIKGDFSSSLRRDIRSAEDLDVSVSVEGIDGTRDIYEDVAARYAEQDETLGPSWSYVRDVAKSMGEDARSFVVRDPDGNYLSGIHVLYGDETMYFWLGGSRSDYEGTSVNSYLHWKIIEDAFESREGITNYDLVGANTERLCEYKSKFAADLTPYYTIESGGVPMALAKRAYQLVVK